MSKYIYNPDTGNTVLREGKKGKEILEKFTEKETVKQLMAIPSRELVEDVFLDHFCSDRYYMNLKKKYNCVIMNIKDYNFLLQCKQTLENKLDRKLNVDQIHDDDVPEPIEDKEDVLLDDQVEGANVMGKKNILLILSNHQECRWICTSRDQIDLSDYEISILSDSKRDYNDKDYVKVWEIWSNTHIFKTLKTQSGDQAQSMFQLGTLELVYGKIIRLPVL